LIMNVIQVWLFMKWERPEWEWFCSKQMESNARVSNVFVTDGSCMPSIACQNPSLTFMAWLHARQIMQ
jgi:hypothetical protein